MASLLSFLFFLFSLPGMLVALGAEATRIIPGASGSGRQLLQLTSSLPATANVILVGPTAIRCLNATHLTADSTDVFAVEVPAGSTDDVDLQTAPIDQGALRQLFQTQGVSGLTVLGGDLAFRFNNSASGKCWNGNGGVVNSNLNQTSCQTSLLLGFPSGINQLFQVLPGPTLPNCTTDKAYQIRVVSSLLNGAVQGSAVGTCLSAFPVEGAPTPFYQCSTDPTLNPYQQFVITNKPFVLPVA